MKKFKVQYIHEDGFGWETDYATNSRKKALKYAKNLAKTVCVAAVRVITTKVIFKRTISPALETWNSFRL